MTIEPPPTAKPRHILWLAGLALVLCAGSLTLFWPGVAMYDTIQQFEQMLSGEYEDWHPPAMARLWAGLHALIGGHGEPMLVLQMTLYWLGFGMIAVSLARTGRMRAGGVVLGIGALPLFLGWQAVVLKDTQLLGAMLAGVGLVAWWRVRGAGPPVLALAGVAVLLLYATLVRANGVFATVPLFVLLLGPARWWVRGVACVVGVGAVLALSPLVNHQLFGAEPSGVERTEAFYDLSAVAARAPDSPVGLTPAEAHQLVVQHCVKPFFWDPLGEPKRCGPILDRLHGFEAKQLYPMLAQAILRHPLDYAAHRFSHLNSTERWLVPAGWGSAAPPAISEPNGDGLRGPGPAAKVWQTLARWTAETPLGWPIAWLALTLAGLATALRRPGTPLRDLALALLVSAVALEGSFGVISIASDLRYHLWPMVATALATVLLAADAPWRRRDLAVAAALLAIVIVPATIARLTLPPPPASYAAMLQ